MKAFRIKYGECKFGWSGWKGSLAQLVEMATTRDQKYPGDLLLKIPDILDAYQSNVHPERDSATINKRFLTTSSASSHEAFPDRATSSQINHSKGAQMENSSQLNSPVVIKITHGFDAGNSQKPLMTGEIFIVLAIKTQKRVKLLTEYNKVATLPMSTSLKFYQVKDDAGEVPKRKSLKSLINSAEISGDLVLRVVETFEDEEEASPKSFNGDLRYLECYEEYFLICFPIQNENNENYPTENDPVILPAYYPVSVATANSFVDASGGERLEELFKVFSKNLVNYSSETSHKFEELTLSPHSEDVYEPIENKLSYRRGTRVSRHSPKDENKRQSLVRREAFAFESKSDFKRIPYDPQETQSLTILEPDLSTEQYEPIQLPSFAKKTVLKTSSRGILPEITVASSKLHPINHADSSQKVSETRSVLTRRLTEEKPAELTRNNFSRHPRKRSDPYPRTPTNKKEPFQLNKFDFNNPTDDLIELDAEPVSRTKADGRKLISNQKTVMSKSMIDIRATLRHEKCLGKLSNYPTTSLSRKKLKWQKNKQSTNFNSKDSTERSGYSVNDPDEEASPKSRKSSTFNMFLKNLVSGFTGKDKESRKKSWSFVASPTSGSGGVARRHGADPKISITIDLDTEIPLQGKSSISDQSSLDSSVFKRDCNTSLSHQYDEIVTSSFKTSRQRSKKHDYRERTLSRSLDDLSPTRDARNTSQDTFIPESVFRERLKQSHISRNGFSGSQDPEHKTSATKQISDPLLKPKRVTEFSPFIPVKTEADDYEIYEDTEENNYEEICTAEKCKDNVNLLSYSHKEQEADDYLDMGNHYIRSDNQTNSRTCELTANTSSKWTSFDQIPTDLSGLLVSEVSMCLDLLNLGKYVRDFAEQQIDGRLLCLLSEDILESDLKLNKLEALKLTRFIKDGWRPK